MVTLVRAEPYWLVWRTRFFSNALTELTLVPTAVMLITSGAVWVRTAPPARRAEAVLPALGLLGVGVVVFAVESTSAIPQLHRTPLVYVLPFLLWGAVRFGPGGASLSLLTTTVMLIGAGMHGRGPFSDLPPAESVLALQVFLIGVGVPCLALAAVVAERRRAEMALGEELSFERTLARLSAAFVRMPCDGAKGRFQTWLGVTGDLLDINGVALCVLSVDEQHIVQQFSWFRRNHESGQDVIPQRDAADVIRRLRTRAPFVYAPGPQSLLIVPLLARARLFGGLGVRHRCRRGSAESAGAAPDGGGRGLRDRPCPQRGGNRGAAEPAGAGSLRAHLDDGRVDGVAGSRAEPAAGRHPGQFAGRRTAGCRLPAAGTRAARGLVGDRGRHQARERSHSPRPRTGAQE